MFETPMYDTANKALSSAGELGLAADRFRQVGPREWRSVLSRIFDAFVNTSDSGVTWLWSHLKRDSVAVQVEDGLREISSMVSPDTAAWLLLEDWDGTKERGNYWVFEGDYSAIIAVLGNMHLIEYYIVDRKCTWMILENHHGALIGVGDLVESFIRNLIKAEPAPLPSYPRFPSE